LFYMEKESLQKNVRKKKRWEKKGESGTGGGYMEGKKSMVPEAVKAPRIRLRVRGRKEVQKCEHILGKEEGLWRTTWTQGRPATIRKGSHREGAGSMNGETQTHDFWGPTAWGSERFQRGRSGPRFLKLRENRWRGGGQNNE